jgi:hypothetical protein
MEFNCFTLDCDSKSNKCEAVGVAHKETGTQNALKVIVKGRSRKSKGKTRKAKSFSKFFYDYDLFEI